MIFGNCLNNIYKGNQLCWFQKWYAFFSKMNIWLRNEFLNCFDCEINYLMWNQSKISNFVFFITLKFSGWFCVGANLLFKNFFLRSLSIFKSFAIKVQYKNKKSLREKSPSSWFFNLHQKEQYKVKLTCLKKNNTRIFALAKIWRAEFLWTFFIEIFEYGSWQNFINIRSWYYLIW